MMLGDERFREGAFSPEDMAMLARAFAEALAILGPEGATEERKTLLGRCLIELARSGEVDRERLPNVAALRVLARQAPLPEE